MLNGTLVFSDSMSKPTQLDSLSTDYTYPVPQHYNIRDVVDTRSIRSCYRSKRVQLDALASTDGINASIYLHGAGDMIPGCVRLYFWRAAQQQGTYDIAPTAVLPTTGTAQYEFLELVCNTSTITKGIAVGRVIVNSVFSEMQVVVMQPCDGVALYLSPRGINPGPTCGRKLG